MRIAAVGDSVMWGQGLIPPLNRGKFESQEKYFFKIVEWLQKIGRVRDFDLNDFQAHSGAIIGAYSQKKKESVLTREEAPNKEIYDLFYGEVPESFPTVLKQLDNLKQGDSIDLLIINGGPNDVGILKSIGLPGTFQEGLRLIKEVAETKLPILLKEARKKCPNAIIFYTGYYPAFSGKSSGFRSVKNLNIFSPALSFIPVDEIFSGTVLALTQGWIQKQGVIFHEVMLHKFREQIAKFNENRDPSTLPIFFSPSGFKHSNSMFAPNQMIFTLEDTHEVTAMRIPFCNLVVKEKINDIVKNMSSEDNQVIESFLNVDTMRKARIDKLLCENAFIAHPNKKGAEQYFKVLKKRLDFQLNYSYRANIETSGKSILSLRKMKEKYPFVPLKSLRGLSDVLWIDVISIKRSIRAYEGPTRNFLDILYFDFGWGYQECNYQNGEYILDLTDGKSLSTINGVKIRIPKFNGIISKLVIDFFISFNGYRIPTITLTNKSFHKSGEDWEWKTSSLNFKPENA